MSLLFLALLPNFAARSDKRDCDEEPSPFYNCRVISAVDFESLKKKCFDVIASYLTAFIIHEFELGKKEHIKFLKEELELRKVAVRIKSKSSSSTNKRKETETTVSAPKTNNFSSICYKLLDETKNVIQPVKTFNELNI